ncbi:SGNH/GDSL hydrolase family protein [Spirosoma sp. KNUC1025]|uniref:SGNH/GDSL hydrolase family protein n=1 Tax=Spirosoma sp. KNUC1025 TaxID=2894082 RepID=UPI003864116C|nr:SGNH/GDSL hydrolase family protein [Spirosoma sp. KNUC1025]
MPELSSALIQLPLNRYDLIILQLDHSLLLSTSTNPSNGQDADTLLSSYTEEVWERPSFWQKLNVFGPAALSTIWPSFGSKNISKLLKQLRPYRHNVLLLTPLPHRDWLNGWLRKRSREILLSEADKHVFSVFDLDSVIRPREEYFLANDKGHLSAISHELLGRELFDFYQSAPTIITIQTIRRD